MNKVAEQWQRKLQNYRKREKITLAFRAFGDGLGRVRLHVGYSGQRRVRRRLALRNCDKKKRGILTPFSVTFVSTTNRMRSLPPASLFPKISRVLLHPAFVARPDSRESCLRWNHASLLHDRFHMNIFA